MENISLHTRLRALVELNVLQIVANPDRHFLKGEGAYHYKGNPIEILPDLVGPAPDNSGVKFDVPTDVAWCPKEKIMLTHARSIYEPFTPLEQPLRRRVS